MYFLKILKPFQVPIYSRFIWLLLLLRKSVVCVLDTDLSKVLNVIVIPFLNKIHFEKKTTSNLDGLFKDLLKIKNAPVLRQRH